MEQYKKDPSFDSRKQKIGQAASELADESRKYVNDLYEEGLNQLDEAQRVAREYSDQMLLKVQRNPLTAVLIAAGVGFILSSLLRK
ncbi:hypothetical protein Lade_2088 [Legionella adelaidensis]|uniref:DUF883 domain-containing protein n=1 Tax=Legionella adelaidensis TaxID=45056 RepID=A0A0W0R198_9GAMM|nr:hypothetical protein [Legionella adelaidensis]KTC64794.1 hypothetical protein Lade_2088 [Legionella adelaidensis]